MTEHKTAQFKQRLLDEKTRLEAERSQYAGDARTEGADDAAGELSHSDTNNPADEATNLYDRDRDQAAIENLDRMLGKVGRALQKIEDGTYGLSDLDGAPIPEARLDALPYAVTTVEQEDQI